MKIFGTYDKNLPHPEQVKEFRKKTTIRAVRMDEDFQVLTLEGLVQGKAGDYLAQGIKGELYPIAADVFDRTYEEVK